MSSLGYVMRVGFFVVLFPFFAVTVVFCQAARPGSPESTTTFHASVPVVLVDVVVTNNHGEPVTGLKGSDFQVFEDGKLQTVASFEEHTSETPVPIAMPQMPAGVFTNYPTQSETQSLNVLLVDGLNTGMQDQTYVHEHILKYLRTIPPGAHVAVFTLTSTLRMLQGFTTDSSKLLAAVNAKNIITSSPLRQSDAEQQANQQATNFLTAERMGPAPEDLEAMAIDPADVLQQMLAETTVRLTEARVRITLDSMQKLAHFLAAFPGRKNVMWVSGAFPIVFLPDSELPNPFASLAGFQDEIERTAALLAAARVAIYPISAEGLAGNTYFQANAMEVSRTRATGQDQSAQLRQEFGQGQLTHEAMEELARDSGGQAFYNTNGISDVLARVTKNSASFYAISYSPINRNMNGKYRHISVKLTTGKDKLWYRRGYFASSRENDGRQQGSDPLRPLVAFGMPDVSQIVYKIRVLPSKTPGGKEKKRDADPIKRLGTTYNLDFAVSLDDLELHMAKDGTRQGKIELELVAYDDAGKPLNAVGGGLALSLKPDQYENMRRVGLQLHQQIDVPGSGAVYLYSGICDLNSGKVGTLGIKADQATQKK